MNVNVGKQHQFVRIKIINVNPSYAIHLLINHNAIKLKDANGVNFLTTVLYHVNRQ